MTEPRIRSQGGEIIIRGNGTSRASSRRWHFLADGRPLHRANGMSRGTPLIVGIGKSITDENDQIQSLPILSHAKMIWFCLGAWLSLARAPGSGPGGRRFKSSRPDL